ncbi:hypothetical protein MCL26_08525 [Acinetobacter pittii]|uniref:hypothetical protein n=1 Tax=Acinetobacter pittii TaxID=48296 RepID=UPI001EFC5D23|nr:hypothetical protein [Acinetobacter pittii]MCG9515153.1 hypothetical protein [Acinetobacter pittii]
MLGEFNAEIARTNANNAHNSLEKLWSDMIRSIEANSKQGRTEVPFIYPTSSLSLELIEHLRVKFESKKFKFESKPFQSNQTLIVISY